MKVVAFNGSPRLVGNTSNALCIVLDELDKQGIETEYVQVYEDHMNPCNCCSTCEIRADGRCVNEDDRMNGYLEMMMSADGVVLASPSYFGSCTAQLKMFLERAGYSAISGGFNLAGKVGAAVVTQEHEGGVGAYSELVNWMLANQMLVVGSERLPIVNGKAPSDFEKDLRGVRALKSLGRNLAEALTALRRAALY